MLSEFEVGPEAVLVGFGLWACTGLGGVDSGVECLFLHLAVNNQVERGYRGACERTMCIYCCCWRGGMQKAS